MHIVKFSILSVQFSGIVYSQYCVITTISRTFSLCQTNSIPFKNNSPFPPPPKWLLKMVNSNIFYLVVMFLKAPNLDLSPHTIPTCILFLWHWLLFLGGVVVRMQVLFLNPHWNKYVNLWKIFGYMPLKLSLEPPVIVMPHSGKHYHRELLGYPGEVGWGHCLLSKGHLCPR